MKIMRDFSDYHTDIYNCIIKGMDFIKGMSYENFYNDEKTQYALIRAIEIIGEASKKIPENIKSQSQEIPWREMAGMRDFLIHDYFGINTSVLWETATKDLPMLEEKLHKLINDLQ